MPNQCVHCGKVYDDAAGELLKGCDCGGHFFYYIKKEKLEELRKSVVEIKQEDKKQIEKDIRDMAGLSEKPEVPVILDLESVRVVGPGKFEIDIVNLLGQKRPLIYKFEEGKYIIDLASTFKLSKKDFEKLKKAEESEN